MVTDGTIDRPIVGVSCCLREINGGLFHTALDKYLTALVDHAGCDVLLVPARSLEAGSPTDAQALLRRLDGLFLTGGRSMVAPARYGRVALDRDYLFDPARDGMVFPLVTAAVDQGLPVLAACRGFQELCAAFGGTLEQDLATNGARMNHRADHTRSYTDRYLPAHDVRCLPGGLLAGIAADAGESGTFAVNSLHIQGVDDVGGALRIEAVAEDGLVEAVSVAAADGFALGVQWHPEWHLDAHPVNRAIYARFGAACRRWRDRGPGAADRPRAAAGG